MDYILLKIKSSDFWEVYLHENQCYLGRVFLLLKDDEGVEDFLSISPEARDEFFLLGAEVKAVIKKLFQYDRMNYAALSNTSQKIHVHFVPRYKEARVFSGHRFTDSRWGKNYAPYDKRYAIEQSLLFQIRDAMIDEFRVR